MSPMMDSPRLHKILISVAFNFFHGGAKYHFSRRVNVSAGFNSLF